MDGTDEDVLERMRDNAGQFEKMSDDTDNRVNGETQRSCAPAQRL